MRAARTSTPAITAPAMINTIGWRVGTVSSGSVVFGPIVSGGISDGVSVVGLGGGLVVGVSSMSGTSVGFSGVS
jgi:hypothetical protein